MHHRCAGILQAQYTNTWTCHVHRESRLTQTEHHPSRPWSKPLPTLHLRHPYRHNQKTHTSNTPPPVPTGLVKPKHNPLIHSHPCCCLPTPMTLASGGSPMFLLVIHQPASPSIWPAVQSLRWGLSTNPGATMWVQLKR